MLLQIVSLLQHYIIFRKTSQKVFILNITYPGSISTIEIAWAAHTRHHDASSAYVRPSDVKYIVSRLAAMEALVVRIKNSSFVLAMSQTIEPATEMPRSL